MWLISKRFDLFWLHAGLWLLPIIALGTVFPDTVRFALVGGTMIFWLGHRFASAQTAFFLPAYRQLVKDEPIRFIAAPIVIFLAVCGFMWIPLGSDQYLLSHLSILATIFFVINSYHFGMQHFGIVSIYQIRANQRVTDNYRTQQRYLCLILGGLLVAYGQILSGAQVARDSWFIGASSWLEFPVFAQRIAGMLVALTLGGLWLIREFKEPLVSWPKRLYILGLGCQSTLAFILSPISFVLIWGLPHWLISVALAGIMAGRSHRSRRTGFLLSFGTLAVFSLVFAPLFYEVSTTAPMNPPAFYEPIIAILSDQTVVRLITAIAFASVYCHFVFDRAIFRFSHPKVRAITAPLVFGQQ